MDEVVLGRTLFTRSVEKIRQLKHQASNEEKSVKESLLGAVCSLETKLNNITVKSRDG